VLRGVSQPLLAAALELPADRPVVLEVAPVGAEEWRCTARLVHRASAEQGLADLRAASAAEVVGQAPRAAAQG
jgi:hypothetical protein